MPVSGTTDGKIATPDTTNHWAGQVPARDGTATNTVLTTPNTTAAKDGTAGTETTTTPSTTAAKDGTADTDTTTTPNIMATMIMELLSDYIKTTDPIKMGVGRVKQCICLDSAEFPGDSLASRDSNWIIAWMIICFTWEL